MFPAFPPQHTAHFLPKFAPQPSQDFMLRPIYHKQQQARPVQADLLSQMMKINMQANLLKLLSQDQAATTHRDINTQPLTLSNYMNRLPTANTQFPPVPDQHDQIIYHKMRQREQALAERARQARHEAYVKQEIVDTYESPIESLQVPAIPALLQDSRHSESPDLSGEENGLSCRSKKM